MEAARKLARSEAASGLAIAIAVAVACAWANAPWLPRYENAWTGSPRFVIDDMLMALFFYVAALELRRERRDGELADRHRALLPIVAALGGMIAPAAIYLAIAFHEPRGFGIPVATDIAFALAVMSLAARGLPRSLRVFLLALAVVDDLGAIAVIAVFYSRDVAIGGLAIAALGTLALVALRRRPRARAIAYALPAIAVWYGLFRAHVHPTLAGVIVGLLAPGDPPRSARAERALYPWIAFGVMPLFALANAGVDVRSLHLGGGARVIAAIVAGLVVGKIAGIVGASALAVRLRVARLPIGASWRGVAVVGATAGVGFTMSLFIAELAFADRPDVHAIARVGLLAGSTLATVVAFACGAYAQRTTG